MLLTVENLSKEYIKKKTLNNVSFSMEKGEILGMLGKSGAGKSTIGKILLQLSRPTTGTILFEGKALSEVPRRDIQAIFQDPYSALNPSLKIGEILEEPLIANGKFTKEERRKKVEETLVKVGLLESDYEKYPEELSGGQQQRVCIAGAIILSPKLIICDEPIASLDLAIQVQILDLIQKINKVLDKEEKLNLDLSNAIQEVEQMEIIEKLQPVRAEFRSLSLQFDKYQKELEETENKLSKKWYYEIYGTTDKEILLEAYNTK